MCDATDIVQETACIMPYLILLAGLDRLDDFLAVKAQLCDLIHHLVINEGGGGHGVRLNDCQVARQVLAEPGMLPASYHTHCLAQCVLCEYCLLRMCMCVCMQAWPDAVKVEKNRMQMQPVCWKKCAGLEDAVSRISAPAIVPVSKSESGTA